VAPKYKPASCKGYYLGLGCHSPFVDIVQAVELASTRVSLCPALVVTCMIDFLQSWLEKVDAMYYHVFCTVGAADVIGFLNYQNVHNLETLV
jgi:hypothetical protein